VIGGANHVLLITAQNSSWTHFQDPVTALSANCFPILSR